MLTYDWTKNGGQVTADISWPLMVGDTIHNLRSALDHLACQLALLAENSIDCCAKTHFPICLEPAKFIKATRDLKTLIDPKALALIEELQPYKTPDSSKTPLWTISQLDIIDKHRVLVVTAKNFRTKELRVTINKGEPVDIPVVNGWRPLEDGAEIGTIDLIDLIRHRHLILAPEYEMNVDTKTELQILFNETNCCDGMPVQYVLLSCIRRVSDVVWLFGRQFFGE